MYNEGSIARVLGLIVIDKHMQYPPIEKHLATKVSHRCHVEKLKDQQHPSSLPKKSLRGPAQAIEKYPALIRPIQFFYQPNSSPPT